MSGLLSTRTVYFDGDRPVPRRAYLNLGDGVLEITLADALERWPLAEIRRLPDSADRTEAILRCTGDPRARLLIRDAAVMRHMPHLNRPSPPRGRARLAAWALAAAAAVAVQIAVLIPLLADNLAGYIPPEGERALGEATFGHIREALDETGLNPVPLCERPNGRAALDRLVVRLGATRDFAQEVTVSVLNHGMINAFALPGGHVVLFRGLIEAAGGPDEVAAVLAHEIGHVVSRDPTRHALRSAGSIGVLGLLLGDFAGGAAVLFLTERLISAQYSQGAEAGADAFAHAILAQAGITPAALGAMFETMRAKHGDSDGLAAHFLSHPSLAARIAVAEAAVNASVTYSPSMSDEEWQALQAICR